jgi:type IV pilus assembly protein PilF
VIIRLKMLFAVLVLALIGACISSTSGPPEPEPDIEAAAREYYQLGAQYYRNGKYELARERLDRALEFDPKSARVHTTLAMTYVSLENPRLATEHFEKAVRYEPDNFDSRNAYAVYLCQQKRFDDARIQFDRAIEVYDNDNAEIMMTNAGVCMANKPDYDLAETYFREALKFKSSYGEALIQLSSLKHKTGNDLHARAFLQRYLVSNATSAPVLYLGIEIESALDDQAAAGDYTKQLLKEFPDSTEAQFMLKKRRPQ